LVDDEFIIVFTFVDNVSRFGRRSSSLLRFASIQRARRDFDIRNDLSRGDRIDRMTRDVAVELTAILAA
jgi:hypothetical protein